jgi:hypothetical protein
MLLRRGDECFHDIRDLFVATGGHTVGVLRQVRRGAARKVSWLSAIFTPRLVLSASPSGRRRNCSRSCVLGSAPAVVRPAGCRLFDLPVMKKRLAYGVTVRNVGLARTFRTARDVPDDGRRAAPLSIREMPGSSPIAQITVWMYSVLHSLFSPPASVARDAGIWQTGDAHPANTCGKYSEKT